MVATAAAVPSADRGKNFNAGTSAEELEDLDARTA